MRTWLAVDNANADAKNIDQMVNVVVVGRHDRDRVMLRSSRRNKCN